MWVGAPRVRQVSTALYRRYRPETFSDVIGQGHVTEPLMAALAGDRVTHAYLFSGPRGCGKTTSARILARCLNCAEGPTDNPCGVCDSCVDLARSGPGSLDVVEIDAASHNGVDDARELRERAAFAPARDRYKIFILDEAHMVTTQGFNALLKLVEEPPPHIKFVFATTEPDKVIGTIRSRTHHYPFRLVPPEELLGYLQALAEAEGISVQNGVLPLVVRAGAGSVRDSLSVLDQLIAGADEATISYERAVALLGFTHGALLDDAVGALAARDGASLFRVVDRVIESGHAPRRFVEDLLERLRDLIVVRAAGESAGAVLRTVPADQLERMHNQAQHLGAGTLSRAADLVNDGLSEMTGATSPRLQLELLCARLLLPAADDGVDGFHARLDRLEGAAASGVPAPAPDFPAVATPGPSADRSEQQATPVPAPPAGPATSAPAAAADTPPTPAEEQRVAESPGPPEKEEQTAQAGRGQPTSEQPISGQPISEQPISAASVPDAPPDAPPGASSTTTGGPPPSSKPPADAAMTADQVRRRWPEVLETLARLKRVTWALISQDAQVVDLSPTTLSVGFSTSGLAAAFRSGPHPAVLAQALYETLGLDVKIEPVLSSEQPIAPTGSSAPSAPVAPSPHHPGPPTGGTNAPGGPVGPPATGPADSAQDRTDHAPSGGGGWADVEVRRPPQPDATPKQGQRAGDPASSSVPTSGPASPPSPDSGSPGSPDKASPAPAALNPPDEPPPWDQDIPPAEPPEDPYAASPGSPSSAPPEDANAVNQAAPSPGPPQEADAANPAAPSSASGEDLQAADPGSSQVFATTSADEEDHPDPSDPDLETSEVVGAPLVARLLGGTVIDEITDDEGQGR